MSATAQIRYYHGTGGGTPGSNVIGSTIYYRLDDTDTVDSTSPILLPASGENLSWRKESKINFTSAPAGAISNLRWFCSGVASGITFYAQPAATYTQASSGDAAGISGFTDNGGDKSANDAAAHSGGSGYTSGSPLSVNSGTVLSYPTTGEGTQDFVMTQGGVLSTYAGGPGPTTWTITYRYAET